MDTLHFEIVRPDKLLHEGEATSVVVIAPSGEVGILPGHDSEIMTLGGGIMRVQHLPNEHGATQTRVVIKGGYAEISSDAVTILANHARDIDDIYPEEVKRTQEETARELAKFPASDSRRPYYEEKYEWCDLLLSSAEKLS